MKLDVIDTVLSSLSCIASKASLGVIGAILLLFLIIGAGFWGGAALMSKSAILGGAVIALAFVAYLAGIAVISVGVFRAFDQKDVSKEMFTENIIWPFLRMTGANISIQAFVLGVTYMLFYPILLVGFMGAGLDAATGLSAVTIAGAALVGIIAVSIILYVLSALLIAFPRIAVDDKRMFQSLDESLQCTKGNRLRIMLTVAPVIVLAGLAMAGSLLGGLIGSAVYAVSVVVSALYMPAILTELNSRLR